MAQILTICFTSLFTVFTLTPAFAQNAATSQVEETQETKTIQKSSKKVKKNGPKSPEALAHEKEVQELEAKNKAIEAKTVAENKKVLAEKKAKAAKDKHIYDEKLKKEKADAGQSTEERIKQTDDELELPEND